MQTTKNSKTNTLLFGFVFSTFSQKQLQSTNKNNRAGLKLVNKLINKLIVTFRFGKFC